MESNPAFDRLVGCFGSERKLALAIEVSPQSVNKWKKIPVEHVLKLEKLVQSKVTRYEMRPDIYGSAM